MSFTSFTSDPTAPADELSALHVPAPAGWKTGGTPPSRASTVAGGTRSTSPRPAPTGLERESEGKAAFPLSTSGEGRGEVAWLVPEALLAEIEPEARPLVQRAFAERLWLAQAEREQPPERRRMTPPPFLYQHLARPRFQQDTPCQQDQAGLHGLLRRTLWWAVDALEAGVLVSAGHTYQPLLAEQCAALGRVYREVKRRAGTALALVILQGELRLLHHRGSAAVEHLLFA